MLRQCESFILLLIMKDASELQLSNRTYAELAEAFLVHPALLVDGAQREVALRCSIVQRA